MDTDVPQTPTLDTITAADLKNLDIPAPRELIPGLITEGLNILAGNPKSGKSFLSLTLAASLATGTPALGSIALHESTNVLYLALEDTRYRLKNRMRGLHLEHSPNLHFATYAPRMSEGGLAAVHEFANQNNVGMVIIDTLAKFSDPKTGANVYDEDAATGTALHSLAHDLKMAVLVVTHTRKLAHSDFLHSVSGSAGFTGTADTVIVMTRKRNDPIATLQLTGRDIKDAEHRLEWYSPKGGWRLKPDDRYGQGPTRRDFR